MMMSRGSLLMISLMSIAHQHVALSVSSDAVEATTECASSLEMEAKDDEAAENERVSLLQGGLRSAVQKPMQAEELQQRKSALLLELQAVETSLQEISQRPDYYECPTGYKKVWYNLVGRDGDMKVISQARTIEQCAETCAQRFCTNFEYAVYGDEEATCITYTMESAGGNQPQKEGWISCLIEDMCLEEHSSNCFDEPCANAMFERRRRAGNMAQCRRRDTGASSTGKYICCGNQMRYF